MRSRNRVKSFQLNLPLYKKGDDFHDNLMAGGSVYDALIALSEQYLKSANLCRKLSDLAAASPHMKAVGGGHIITVTAQEQELLDILLYKYLS